MKFLVSIMFFLLLSQSGSAQPEQEKLSLGSGQLTENDKKINVIVEYGVLFSATTLKYDTVLWIEDRDGMTPLLYPQLSEGDDHVIQLKLTDTDNPGHFYELFILLKDSLTQEYSFTADNTVLYAIPGGQLHSSPYQLTNLSGHMEMIAEGKKDYRVKLEFESVHIINQNEQKCKFKGDFLLPASKYRESDLTSPVAEKTKNKIYRRNMQFAGLMVMLFLAIFFFD